MIDIGAGRRALVTGGASGFGLRIAQRLHEAGAAVAIVDINADSLAVAASSIGPDVLPLVADVRSRSEMAEVITTSRDKFGGLDTLVICAGIFGIAPIEKISDDHWANIIDINLGGAMVTIQAATADLKASGVGRIVTIGSDAARRGYALEAAYVASKFGLVGLTESIAAELAPHGVTANCICPSFAPTTGMGKHVLAAKAAAGLPVQGAEMVESLARSTPLGRNATADDIANVALFLVSPYASFITGVSIDVDGGAHLGVTAGLK